MASITVRGSAHQLVSPDRAQLELGFTHVAATAAEAMDAIAARSHQLAEIIADLGFTSGDWSTHGISVAEEWEWKNETNTRVGFRATSGVTVRINATTDSGDDGFARIAPLLQRAIDTAGAQSRNLTWSVSAGHQSRRDLLGLAALDATARAESYAGPLGLRLGPIEEVSDLPITSAPSTQQPIAMRAAKMSDDSQAMNVNAGEIELSASVFIRFATLP